MTNVKFKGIMPALITPFDNNYKIIKNTVKELIDCNYDKGVNGFYICGSTGEGPVLTAKMRIEMAEEVMQCNNGRGAIINHVGANSFEEIAQLVKHSNEINVDAVSALPPFYFGYTDDEVVSFYKAIADMTDKPVIAYITDMIKTGDMVGLVKRLVEVPNIIGLKYTKPNYFEFRKIKEINNGDINVINGPDEMLICGLVMGADGGIGTTYNVMSEWFVKLYECFTNGDLKQAQEYQYKINRVVDLLIKHSDVGAIKATKETLKLMGFDAGCSAFPAKTYTDAQITALKDDLKSVGFDI